MSSNAGAPVIQQQASAWAQPRRQQDRAAYRAWFRSPPPGICSTKLVESARNSDMAAVAEGRELMRWGKTSWYSVDEPSGTDDLNQKTSTMIDTGVLPVALVVLAQATLAATGPSVQRAEKLAHGGQIEAAKRASPSCRRIGARCASWIGPPIRIAETNQGSRDVAHVLR